ncbi:MAG: HAMP domain-containing protein [candidate division Zixibacteria bacterium]|nr:HAMP domain-containing protein [candidate division Zixibacteria bacterium]
MPIKDPFSGIPLKVKLPLGFVALFFCVVGASGYEVLHSVYAPPTGEIAQRFAGITGITAAAILMLMFLSVRYVVRPLDELRLMAQRIREGDFSARNTIDSEDEIGQLAHTVNLMAEAVQDRTAHLERTAGDLNRREHELRVQHNLMNTVIQSMTDGVILIDGRGEVALSNRAAASVVDVVGNTGEPFGIRKCQHHTGDSARCAACMSDLSEATRCVLAIRDRIYEVLSTQVLIDRDRAKILVSSDITEQEAMRRQQAHQERLMVLGKLSAVVAHEMNNPLAAISMYGQMMEDELPADAPCREHVEVIRRNTDSCQRIIRELLDYARTPQPQIAQIDLHRLIDDVLRFLKPLHAKPGIEIRRAYAQGEALCWGDAVQLQQVLVKLLVNAFQAVEDEKGCICIRSEAGKRWTIDIEDNGPGVPESLRCEIFEPFFTTRRSGGTGLGLPTARRIIEANGGTLDLLESRPGKTVFRFSLPGISDRPDTSLLSIETAADDKKTHGAGR